MVLRERGVDVDTPLDVYLNIGKVQVSSPESMKLRPANDGLQAALIEEHINQREASLDMLMRLNAVQIRPIAAALQTIIRQSAAPQSLATLVLARPITRGMEELVAYYRVLRAALNRLPENKQSVDDSQEYEELLIADEQGQSLKVRVPLLRVTANEFPEHLDDLAI